MEHLFQSKESLSNLIREYRNRRHSAQGGALGFKININLDFSEMSADKVIERIKVDVGEGADISKAERLGIWGDK